MAHELPVQIDDIIAIAKQAGGEILRFYSPDDDANAHDKADNSAVTDADIAADKLIVSRLASYGYPIVSEESHESMQFDPDSDYAWLVDPLDGTNDFIAKTDEFAVMIGLTYKQEPVLGVVYMPVDDIVYWGQKGAGSFVRKRDDAPAQLHVGDVDSPENACFMVSRTHFLPQERQFLTTIGADHIVPMGSIGLKLGAIATQQGDAMFAFTPRTSQWDSCAPQVICTEAGGLFTDLNGDSLIYDGVNLKNAHGLLAANPALHSQLVQALKTANRTDQ